jgi:cyclohexadienyl dehydratase
VARVSAKMAALVVRLPPGLEPAAVAEQARDWLGASGLEPSEVELLARTLAGLRPHAPSAP